MRWAMYGWAWLGRHGQKLGPYLLLIAMPGGTLLALALFLYQRRGTGTPITASSGR